MIRKLRYTWGVVKEVYNHNRLVKSFTIEGFEDREIMPGQFIMVWIPDYEEIPLSPSYYNSGELRVTVMKRGETTNKIHMMRVGDRIFFRGPYGNGFNLDFDGRYLLVGGGYGSAPIIYAAHILHDKDIDFKYVEGVKTLEDCLFISEAEKHGMDTVLVTEDGSSGVKGLVTDYVEKVVDEYDIILGCGPEPMLLKLFEICRKYGVRCQLSFEALVKCGIGICGTCELFGTGLLVCRDGPVFDDRLLINYIGDSG